MSPSAAHGNKAFTALSCIIAKTSAGKQWNPFDNPFLPVLRSSLFVPNHTLTHISRPHTMPCSYTLFHDQRHKYHLLHRPLPLLGNLHDPQLHYTHNYNYLYTHHRAWRPLGSPQQQISWGRAKAHLMLGDAPVADFIVLERLQHHTICSASVIANIMLPREVGTSTIASSNRKTIHSCLMLLPHCLAVAPHLPHRVVSGCYSG